jgi:hypothetical protein
MSADKQLTWTPEATAYLKKIPFFVRPVAKKRIEAVARQRGATEVTVELMDAAKPGSMSV